MSDLISRSALLAKIGNVCRVTEYDETGCGMEYRALPEWAVMLAPAVDAVPVVRCRECKYFKWGDYCTQDKMEHSKCRPDEFCSCGEKNDGGSSDDED